MALAQRDGMAQPPDLPRCIERDAGGGALVERVEGRILTVRGRKVILDSHIAGLYGVSTGNLNLAVRRNRERFPADFMFRLAPVEVAELRLQFASWGGRRFAPYVFTEQGVAMLSGVLRSRRAVLVNVAIMRAFVRVRGALGAHTAIARKIDELERRIGTHGVAIRDVFEALRRLTAPPLPGRRRIGF